MKKSPITIYYSCEGSPEPAKKPQKEASVLIAGPCIHGIDLESRRIGFLDRMDEKVKAFIKSGAGSVEEKDESIHVRMLNGRTRNEEVASDASDAAAALARIKLLRMNIETFPKIYREKIEKLLDVTVNLAAEMASIGLLGWLGARLNIYEETKIEGRAKGHRGKLKMKDLTSPQIVELVRQGEKEVIACYLDARGAIREEDPIRDQRKKDRDAVGYAATMTRKTTDDVREIVKVYRGPLIAPRPSRTRR